MKQKMKTKSIIYIYIYIYTAICHVVFDTLINRNTYRENPPL